MKREKTSKRGFTLVELVVVLAILAIVAAIAVPVAFGSLEKARDSAAASSIDSVRSVIAISRTISLTDNDFQKMLSQWKSAMLEFYDGSFKTVPATSTNEYEKYLLSAMNDCNLRVPKETFIMMYVNESKDQSMPYYYIVLYAPKGTKATGLPMNLVEAKLNFPYYRYESQTGVVTKYKADGTSEVVATQ